MSVVWIDTKDAERRASVRSLIRAAMERIEDPDPHVIAKVVAEELTPEDLEALAVPLLVVAVRQQIHSDRKQAFHAPVGAPTSAKWNRAQESAESGALRALRTQWHVDGAWMRLADMRKTHLEWVRDDYLRRAAENDAWASRFDRLAKKAGKRTVAELSHAVIEDAWTQNA